MIKAKNVSFTYDTVSVLKNITFEIEDGDFVAVVGPNGAGKTTLAELLVGLLPMQKGDLEIDGIPIQNIKERTTIGYMPQRYSIDKLFPGTVREILNAQEVGLSRLHPELDIHSLLPKKFVELSGGQQQRVLVALAMHNNPKVLILDEPTVGVDAKTMREFLKLLKHISMDHRITILLITHDVGLVPSIANKTLCINHDICCIGPSSDTNKMLKKIYGSYVEHHHV